MTFNADEIAAFQRDGFVIVRGLADAARVTRLRAAAQQQLANRQAPVEYESDLGYPGAPASQQAAGGTTVRRLLQAYARDPLFADWARAPAVVTRVQQLLGGAVVLPQAHHNCIMTKQPSFSSETHWHQDIRYWSYTRPELVSVWLALGEETRANGCLWVLPGTQRMSLARDRFDERLFFRADLPQNRALIDTAVAAELHAGDVLFFHALTLHAAGRNTTGDTKFSLVFTYRPADNPPRPNTRSAASAEIALDV